MSSSESDINSAPGLDTPVEVPSVTSVPNTNHTVEYADYLLTALLRHNSAQLHGEFRDGLGVWSVRPRPGEDIQVARFDSVGAFRSVLARFGYRYMAVQLYGGYARRILTQGGRSYICVIHMSNDNWTGYWLRVYARV
jgi:hypothetical protein